MRQRRNLAIGCPDCGEIARLPTPCACMRRLHFPLRKRREPAGTFVIALCIVAILYVLAATAFYRAGESDWRTAHRVMEGS